MSLAIFRYDTHPYAYQGPPLQVQAAVQKYLRHFQYLEENHLVFTTRSLWRGRGSHWQIAHLQDHD
jgi:hypothetical protein